MIRKISVLLMLLFGVAVTANAQFYSTQYRPPNQNWQYLKTPHFKLIYAKGNDSTALQMGQILEKHYEPVQDLVGGSLHGFPVVLNDYNDRSNGFVTPFHFRSEIELPPIKGKSLNPQTGNWLESVAPHELVHALQISNLGDYNIPQLINIFSPDIARSIHGAIPFGVLEGLAVYHETKNIAPHGGRGNFPIFTNQFDAAFQSGSRWSMGEIVQLSSRTRPFGRHYIGGYEFISWLQNRFGDETTKQALDFFMDFPFLGYGVALRHATGSWPGQLYDQFEKQKEQSITSPTSSTEITELKIPYKGREIRRPQWLSNSELIFYGSFYNARFGFYRYDLDTNTIDPILTTGSVEDYRYDLSSDRSKMVYSYYETNPIYDNTRKAELVEFDLKTQQKRQLSDNGRLYAPNFAGDSLFALQTAAASSQLVSIRDDRKQSSKVNSVLSLGNHEIKAVASNPVNQKLAVVTNKRGLQGLWITDRNNLQQELEEAPDISFQKGSVFDPSWHPDGNKLLFSSGFSGIFQLYEFNLETNEVHQITDARFNAFEGSYSPDGTRIAYIRQVKNERLPALIHNSDFLNKKVEATLWQPSKSKSKYMQRPVVSDSMASKSTTWQSGTYSSGASWLKPRTVIPVLDEVGNRNVYKAGISFHSNNTLADQMYAAEASYLEGRGWYNLTYQNKTFFPGFKARLFSEPSYRTVSGPGTLLRQERGMALSVPFRVRLNQNIYNTSFFLEPEIRRSQIRFFETSGSGASSDFMGVTIGNIFGQFNYRLQQNIRDLQPNTGLTFYTEAERASSASDIISTSTNNFSVSTSGGSALRSGVFGYLSPLRRWNQSLRLGLEGITQSGTIMDNQSIVSDGFSEPILAESNNLLSFSTRYTIPLAYVDDGGFLLPLYLSNIYLVAFTNTVTDPTLKDWYNNSRSVFGLGLRAQFRLSNFSFDIGVGYGYEPTRQKSQFFIGNF